MSRGWTALCVLALGATGAGGDVPITGGSPAQQQQLRDAYNAIPVCIRNCDGKPVPIVISQTADNRATYTVADDWEKRIDHRKVTFYQGLFGGEAFDQAQKKVLCATSDDFKWLLDPTRVMLHELAHHVHYACKSGDKKNEDLINEFAALKGGYDDKIKAALADKTLTDLSNDMGRLMDQRPTTPDANSLEYQRWGTTRSNERTQDKIALAEYYIKSFQVDVDRIFKWEPELRWEWKDGKGWFHYADGAVLPRQRRRTSPLTEAEKKELAHNRERVQHFTNEARRFLRKLEEAKRKLAEAEAALAEQIEAWEKELCRVQRDYMARYKTHNFPMRSRYDDHAADDADGGEYFAIFVETLIYDHDVFCGSGYSDDERKWLAENSSGCLRQLSGLAGGLAPCFPDDENAAQTAQALGNFTENMNPGRDMCEENDL